MSTINLVPIVDGQLSDKPITQASVVAFLQRELIPLFNKARIAINSYMPSPRIPRFASSPVTDDDYLTLPYRVVAKDGMLSYSAPSLGGDGKLYVRDGSETHVAVP